MGCEVTDNVLPKLISNARRKLLAAKIAKKPTVALRLNECEALFTAIQMGRTLALAHKRDTSGPWWKRMAAWLRDDDTVKQIRREAVTHSVDTLDKA